MLVEISGNLTTSKVRWKTSPVEMFARAALPQTLRLFAVILAVVTSSEFKDAVIRAQCQAACLQKHGAYERKDASDWALYSFYKPRLQCRKNNSDCTSCMLPCRYIFDSLERCRITCTTSSCKSSCSFIYGLKQQLQSNFPASPSLTSKVNITVSAVTVCCQETSQHARDSVNLYLRWDVQGQWTAPSLPVTFVVEIRANNSRGLTSWTPFITYHGWVPVIVNASTLYQFRATPVMTDGIAGRTKTSNWTLATHGRYKPVRPAKVFVIEQKQIGRSVYVVIGWTPGSVPLCHYNLALLPHSSTAAAVHIRIPLIPEFKYRIGPLEYDTRYSVVLTSCTREYLCSSDSARTALMTSSCLEATNHNYNLCPPDSPADLSWMFMEEKQIGKKNDTFCHSTFLITWIVPQYASVTNEIKRYIVSWHQITDITTAAIHSKTVSLPGNTTSYLLDNLHTNNVYDVGVIAVSSGGRSKPTVSQISTAATTKICMEVKPDTTALSRTATSTSNLENVWVYIVIPGAVFLVLSMSLAVVYWKVHQCRWMLLTQRPHQEMTGNPLYLPVRVVTSVPSHRVVDGSTDGPTQTPRDAYEVDFDSLALEQELGQGAFGRVVKARLSSCPHWLRGTTMPMTVAVKMLKDYPSTLEDRANLQKEISLMKSLGRHKHIVSLIACCSLSPTPCLVMDYCCHGDLSNYLRKLREKRPNQGERNGGNVATSRNVTTAVSNTKDVPQGGAFVSMGENGHSGQMETTDSCDSGKPTSPPHDSSATYLYTGSGAIYLDVIASHTDPSPNPVSTETDADWRDTCEARLLLYARQIALGMEYLSQKKFVHRDLAGRNVLVCDSDIVKISDFGLTRDIYETNVYFKETPGRLPVKWMSVEAIFDQVYTTKSDVWSFGIVLWEIMTLGGAPYPGISSQQLLLLLKEGYRMGRPNNCSQCIYDMMAACWLTSPTQRPSFTQLKEQLGQMLNGRLEEPNSSITLDLQVDQPNYSVSDVSSRFTPEQDPEPAVDTNSQHHHHGNCHHSNHPSRPVETRETFDEQHRCIKSLVCQHQAMQQQLQSICQFNTPCDKAALLVEISDTRRGSCESNADTVGSVSELSSDDDDVFK